MITIHICITSPLYCIHVTSDSVLEQGHFPSMQKKHSHFLITKQGGNKGSVIPSYAFGCTPLIIWSGHSLTICRCNTSSTVLSTCWATSQWAMCGAGACLLQLRGQKMSCCGFFPSYCILKSFSLHRGLSCTVSMPQMGGEQQLVCVLLLQDLNDSVCPCLSTCP